jgi:hypothetical protein
MGEGNQQVTWSHADSMETATEDQNRGSKKCDQMWFKSQPSKVTNFETLETA